MVLVPGAAVGAIGTPVNVGETKFAGVNVNAVVTSPDVNVTAPVLVLNEETSTSDPITA